MRITSCRWLALPILLAACGPSPALHEPEPLEPVGATATPEWVEGAAQPQPLAQRHGGGFLRYQGGQLAAGAVYEGRYLCAQGDTGMKLRIAQVQGQRVSGVFEFFHEPTDARGSFSVEGTLRQSGEITFDPIEWIVHPPRYVAVPFRVTVSENGETLQGGVLHESCGSMVAHRAATP